MAVGSLLLEIGILFAVLALAGSLAHWLGQSVIPFYLAAGLVIDPAGMQLAGRSFSLVTNNEFLTGAAELGVVLLLFFLGLKFSISSLVEGRARITKAGAVDAVNLLLGIGLGLAFGFSIVEALFLGGIVYISSSAVITKALIDLDWIPNPESEAVLGVLVFEDLFVALYISILSAAVLEGGGFTSVLVHVGLAVAIMGLLVLLAVKGTRRLEALLDHRSEEIALLRALAITVLVSALALLAGLSEAVAAFFVGMAIGETLHAPRLGRLARPLRDVFGAVFFFWIGLNADPAVLTRDILLLGTLVVLTGLGKVVTGVIGARAYGLDARRRVRVGIALIPRGEFSLVIAALAALVGGSTVMTQEIPALTVGYVLVTSVVGTLAMQHAGWFEALGARDRHGPPGPSQPGPRG